MNEGIELHDSELTAVSLSGGDVVVSFMPAWIHRTVGRPGVDGGSAWLQRATLSFCGALLVSAPTMLPANVSDGFLRIGAEIHNNLIPASGTFAGTIEFSVVLKTGEEMLIRAQHLTIQRHGKPSYVEDFTP